MANSADFDQTAPKEQSDQSFHCFVLPLFQLRIISVYYKRIIKTKIKKNKIKI